MRHRPRKDKEHNAIAKGLEQYGWTVCDMSALGNGKPDMAVAKGGRTVMLEVKSEGGKLTPMEQEFITHWRGEMFIVRNLAEALRVLGEAPNTMLNRAQRVARGFAGALLAAALLFAPPAGAVTRTVCACTGAELAAAVAASVAGDVVFLPAGDYTLSSTITVPAGIRIYGEGPTTRVIAGTSMYAFLIDSTSSMDGLRISDLALVGNGNGAASGTGSLDGIHYGGLATKKLTDAKLERLVITGFKRGIYVSGSDSTTGAVERLAISDCEVRRSSSRGIQLQFALDSRIAGTATDSCGANGIYARTCPNLGIWNCSAAANNQQNDTTDEGGAQATVKLSDQFVIAGLKVKNMPVTASYKRIGLTISGCVGGFVSGYDARADSLLTDGYGVKTITSSRGIHIGSMTYKLLQFPIIADGTSVYPQTAPRSIIKF